MLTRRLINARDFARLWLYGHALHWRDRNRFLNDKGRIELLQRCLAVLSLIVGGIMAATRHGDAGSLLVRTMDGICGPALAAALSCLPPSVPRFAPHQAFGAVLIASSLALLVAVYEWPDAVDHESEADARVADARLLRLLRMHLFGHVLALNYWALTGLLLLISHPLALGPWVSFYIAYNHHWLYRRNNAEYEREQGAALRARRVRESGGVAVFGGKTGAEATSACH